MQLFIFVPSTTYEKTSFTKQASRSFTNGFSDPKTFREFRETGPKPCFCNEEAFHCPLLKN